jgi:5-histidylcysteine sulfoxide synthase/putative 4-mercaptohistidine N1-methyltranferase
LIKDNKNNTIALNEASAKEKKQQLLEYYKHTYKQYETLFFLLDNDDGYYAKANKDRHPLIFYFGHTAVFYINKLLASGDIKEPLNREFERTFAVGVDEMYWDDLCSSNYNWPKIKEVVEYRDLVFDLVVKFIENMDLDTPIGWNDSAWIILMGIEHERIHLETSSVLIRQLPLQFVKPNDRYKSCSDYKNAPKNFLVDVAQGIVDIARAIEGTQYYGWDNEFGECKNSVDGFLASKFLVSNAEFLEFYQNSGYQNREFWDSNGWDWIISNKIKYPEFWIVDGDTILQRNLAEVIALPLSWPVEVNYHEAKAFCKYISKRDNKTYSLPTENEWHRLKDESLNSTESANISLSIYASSMPVDSNKQGDFYDIIGNVWQWCETTFYPFDNFVTHKVYDDFSVPIFDDEHNIIKGGSWISTGNVSMTDSRYAFRKHFHQHSGFRYVVSNSEDEMKNDIYESDFLVSQYCEFHYGDRYFGVDNFSKKLAEIAVKYVDKNSFTKAFDIGCAVGRCSFELSKFFKSVVGLDYSTRFIKHAVSLQNSGSMFYRLPMEGDSYKQKEINKNMFDFKDSISRVEFWQGDANNLKSHFKDFDLVVAANLIDRLREPKRFLQNIHKIINSNGLLILASPYTWLEEFTAKEDWFSGFNSDGTAFSSLDTIKDILKEHFSLIKREDVEFVIRETNRKYQHSISEVSVWKKLSV